jgi:glycosyltransferase involved in cell wall biosynthesis
MKDEFKYYGYCDNFQKVKNVNTKLLYGDRKNVPDPFLSIIITVYKRKEYIADAVYSAVNQKNIQFEYEIIVIDDDPDSLPEFFKQFLDIKNIYFYKNSQNIGLYNACNAGAEIARGKYIAFLHDDDILYPNYLFELYNFIRFLKPTAECVLTNRDTTGDYIQKSKSRKTKKVILKALFSPLYFIRIIFRKPYKLITLKEGLTYQLSNVYKAPTCGALFKKDAFMKSGGFNQDFWPVTDYFFFLNFNQNHKIYMLRKKTACYRWFDNLSQNKSIQFSSLKLLNDFFCSEQPIRSINLYFKLFGNEALYAKYLMVSGQFQNEIKPQYPQIANLNRIKWILFKTYNIAFRFFHDII